MKKLLISDELSLPIEAATQTFLVVGKRGSGKTNTAARIVEQLLAGAESGRGHARALPRGAGMMGASHKVPPPSTPPTRALAYEAEDAAHGLPPSWRVALLVRLSRDLHAVADSGREMADEQLRIARDVIGLVGGGR